MCIYVLLLPALEDTFPGYISIYKALPQLCFVLIFIFTTKSEKFINYYKKKREYV